MKYVEQAFIGEVFSIDVDQRIYKIRIVEVFKGTLEPGEIIDGNGMSTCPPYVESEGKWLMLGSLVKNEFIVHGCGQSRSFANPEFNTLIKPQFPSKDFTEEELIVFRAEEHCRIKNLANIYLQNDIEYFRKNKTTPNNTYTPCGVKP